MAKKITRVDATTHTEVEMTMAETAVAIATAPLGAFTTSEEYFNKQTLGLASLTWLGAGVFLGDKFGDSIPILGGRR